MSILGLDYGDKNIGVATSCPNLVTALGVETIRRTSRDSFKKPILRLREIMRERGTACLILGYPKNMDGSEGSRCEKTLEFKDRLQRNFKSLEIVLWDERLSSLSAERAMREMGFSKKAINSRVDETAAILILQGYLDYINK
ncbi:MAG: Holliday junction resolvase RuvX [Defluviitaleaceae bacterium]|nr:Holliday junction resolvase RuvX [Defluviitaleaceae bacterium]